MCQRKDIVICEPAEGSDVLFALNIKWLSPPLDASPLSVFLNASSQLSFRILCINKLKMVKAPAQHLVLVKQ